MPDRSTGVIRVGWTRGKGCSDLAHALGRDSTVRVEGDLNTACVSEGLDLVVTRRLTSFDLTPVAVPQSLDLQAISSITAAVGDGPHSPMAIDVASRLAENLEVAFEVVTVYRSSDDEAGAGERLARLLEDLPGTDSRRIQASSPSKLAGELPSGSLLVVGAPGGSWFQRQIYGSGHRLIVSAPSGAVVVKSAPTRCFRLAEDAHGGVVGPHMSVSDATNLATSGVLIVAEEGRLVGLVRLADVDPDDPRVVSDVMDPPVAVGIDEPIEAIASLRDFFDGAPVPVTDRRGMIIGVVPTADEAP